jgi:hypothetical protein
MDNNKKLELLSKEFEATMNHASEVMDEIIATAVEQVLMEAIDNLSDAEKLAILLDIISEEEPEEPEEPEDYMVELFKAMNKEIRETEKNFFNFGDNN